MLNLLETLKQLELQFEATPKFFMDPGKHVIIPLCGQQIQAMLEYGKVVEQLSLSLKPLHDERMNLVRVALDKTQFLKLIEVQPSEMLEILYA